MLRLREFRKQNKVSQQVLADMLGVTQATLSGWENEKFQIDNASLAKCADYFGVTVDELMGRTIQQSRHRSGITIPVLGYVAAGIPIEAVENVLDYEELDSASFSSNYDYFGLKIKGESMMPRIQSGDVVIVRRQADVESGDVAIVSVSGNEATCKQVKKHMNGISLVSYNPAYDIMFFTNEEISALPVTILGKVVELRGKF